MLFGFNRTRGLVNKKDRENGFTLIECVLVMVLSSVVLTSLFSIIQVVQNHWWLQSKRKDVLYDGSQSMRRMTSELRYAQNITQLSAYVLEFETKYLLDDDDDIEVIRYERISAYLYRSVDGGTNERMTKGATRTAFYFQGWEWNGSTLVQTAIPGDADAIEINQALTMSDAFFGSSFEMIEINSMVWLRNKD